MGWVNSVCPGIWYLHVYMPPGRDHVFDSEPISCSLHLALSPMPDSVVSNPKHQLLTFRIYHQQLCSFKFPVMPDMMTSFLPISQAMAFLQIYILSLNRAHHLLLALHQKPKSTHSSCQTLTTAILFDSSDFYSQATPLHHCSFSGRWKPVSCILTRHTSSRWMIKNLKLSH